MIINYIYPSAGLIYCNKKITMCVVKLHHIKVRHLILLLLTGDEKEYITYKAL